MKIGFLITVRLKSSRLPLKVLMDLNGETVIGHVITRAKKIGGISDIVVCTSINPQDKPLVDIAKENDVYYFNGSEEDVLNRLLTAAKLFDLDYFLGITGENPLFSIYYSNMIVDQIKSSRYDFITIEGLPFGAATFGMNVKALETVCKVKQVIDTEFWGPLINRPELFNLHTIEIDGRYKRPDIALSLDYKEDYELLRKIFSEVPYKTVPNLLTVIDYLDKNPDVANINANCKRLSLDEKVKNQIDRYYAKNLDKIKKIKNEIYS